MEINAIDYWWKRAKKAEELLGRIKYEAEFDENPNMNLDVIKELLKDVKVVKPKSKKKDE